MSRALFVLPAIALAAAAGIAFYLTLRADTISIRVRGVEERVAAGTTLGTAAQRFGLRPTAGDLLDVEGVVLRRGAFPGRLLVNGRRAPGTRKLANGDRLWVVSGRSRTEPTVHVLVPVPGGMPANPQFTLATTPGVQEIERGSISGKVRPVEFRPSGPARVPRAVALTFDDGPSPYTSRILSELERLHARATFFVIGDLVGEYPRLVRRELAAGMAVGSHSYSHPNYPGFERLPHPVILAQIANAREALARLGAAPTLFRPPGGSFSPYVIEATGAAGERIVLWSVDPTDWKRGTTAGQIKRHVLEAVRPGSIIVLHDGGGDRSQTAEALPDIVRGIRKKGLRLALLEPGRPT